MSESGTDTPIEVKSDGTEKVLSFMERVFNETPLAYKRFVTFGDWLMVMGGIKAGTDIGFLGDTYQESDYLLLRSTLERERLRLTDLDIQHHIRGEPFRQVLVYNPQALAEQTARSDLVLPYDGSEDIQDWIKRCVESGKDKNAIYGKIYSFPESAIRDFLKQTNFPWLFNLLERVGFKKGRLHLSGNEAYWHYGSAEYDVIERENKKQLFFRDLEQSPRYAAIMESQDLKDSDAEWSRRLPEWIRGKGTT